MEVKEMTLEEIVVKIWGMAQVCVKDNLTPYKDNVVRQETLNWALFELNERAEIALKAGRKEVVEWSNEPCILHGNSDARIRQGQILRQGNCYECWQAQLKVWGLSKIGDIKEQRK